MPFFKKCKYGQKQKKYVETINQTSNDEIAELLLVKYCNDEKYLDNLLSDSDAEFYADEEVEITEQRNVRKEDQSVLVSNAHIPIN